MQGDPPDRVHICYAHAFEALYDSSGSVHPCDSSTLQKEKDALLREQHSRFQGRVQYREEGHGIDYYIAPPMDKHMSVFVLAGP